MFQEMKKTEIPQEEAREAEKHLPLPKTVTS